MAAKLLLISPLLLVIMSVASLNCKYVRFALLDPVQVSPSNPVPCFCGSSQAAHETSLSPSSGVLSRHLVVLFSIPL